MALPFFVITVEAGLRSMDRRYEDVAATLGRRALDGVPPGDPAARSWPSVIAGAVLAWARALGEFGATITFAGNIVGKTQTLPLAVYLALEANPDVAIALSLVLLGRVAGGASCSLRDRWLERS